MFFIPPIYYLIEKRKKYLIPCRVHSLVIFSCNVGKLKGTLTLTAACTMVVDGTSEEPTGFKLLVPNEGMLVMRRAEGTHTACQPVFVGGEASFKDLHIDVVKTFVAAINNVLRKLQSKPNAEVQTNNQSA